MQTFLTESMGTFGHFFDIVGRAGLQTYLTHAVSISVLDQVVVIVDLSLVVGRRVAYYARVDLFRDADNFDY